MRFEFAHTPQIIFGLGRLTYLPGILLKYDSQVLLVTGKSSFYGTPLWKKLIESLRNNNIHWERYIVSGEPSPSVIDQCINDFGGFNPGVIVAIGGGSVMDAGKAISAMWPLKEPVKLYLEGVGDGRSHNGKKIPYIAVPTTAGTGSEATKNAVISEVGENGFKKSLRHDHFVPDLALIDPELTVNCPSHITAWSGMDAFTQLLESYISTNSSPLTDALAISGLYHISKSLDSAVRDGHNLKARTGMSYAALCSGITLANAGLGVVHGFASSIGGRFSIPHGLICGSLMGISNRITLNKVVNGSDNRETIRKYACAGKLFSQSEDKEEMYYARLLIEKIYEFTETFKFPKFSKFGFDKKYVDVITKNTSCKYNPVKLSLEELTEILESRI